MEKEVLQIVWLKRDLRLRDHEPLSRAINTGLPTLIIYVFEPEQKASPDWDIRHERFIYQSLLGINQELRAFNQKVWILQGNMISILEMVGNQYKLPYLFSYQETGIETTYIRDKLVRRFCQKQDMVWLQSQNNGVIRGIRDRKTWLSSWHTFMASEVLNPVLNKLKPLPKDLPEALAPFLYFPIKEVRSPHPAFQEGGEIMAWRYLVSFFNNRIRDYSRHISKPTESRISCSRLSPYLSWGNITIRQVFQYSLQQKKTIPIFNFQNFQSRIHWHCHFIQKFETEGRIEKENVNRAFNSIREDWNEPLFLAWREAETGFPLIDACMKAVKATGYLNFRMRALLVSFLTHHLWLDWRPGAWFLARQFLDYEPGIHFSQFQMQAGTMGINTIRIYNPIKQSQEQDPEGIFIKKWIPALVNIPPFLLHEPWKMSLMEQDIYGCQIGKDYPGPVINLEETGRIARESLWKVKKSQEAKYENEAILNRLTHRASAEEPDGG